MLTLSDLDEHPVTLPRRETPPRQRIPVRPDRPARSAGLCQRRDPEVLPPLTIVWAGTPCSFSTRSTSKLMRSSPPAITICPQQATIRRGASLQSGSAPGEWRTPTGRRARALRSSPRAELADDARGTRSRVMSLPPCAADPSECRGQLRPRCRADTRSRSRPRRIRSGAHPTALLTTTAARRRALR